FTDRHLHHHLPPSPTRRSSDLPRRRGAGRPDPAARPRCAHPGAHSPRRGLDVTGILGALVEAWEELRIHKLRVLLSLVGVAVSRSEEHTSELQSRFDLVCRLLL